MGDHNLPKICVDPRSSAAKVFCSSLCLCGEKTSSWSRTSACAPAQFLRKHGFEFASKKFAEVVAFFIQGPQLQLSAQSAFGAKHETHLAAFVPGRNAAHDAPAPLIQSPPQTHQKNPLSPHNALPGPNQLHVFLS